MKELRTRSPLLNLLRRDPEDRQHLGHYLNDCMHHFGRRYQLSVDFEPSEKTFDTLENINKSFLASANISNCLKDIGVKTGNRDE